MPSTKKEHTAYHEAGHAAVKNHFGLAINYVTIKPSDEDTLGEVASPPMLYYAHYGRRVMNQIIRQHVIEAYAGAEAERLFCSSVLENGADDDEMSAFELLREYPVRGCSYVGDDVYCAYLERLRREARKLVKQLRWQIETIATALLERETLTGEEISAILEV